MQCVLRAFLINLQHVLHHNFHARLRSACSMEGLPTPYWSASLPVPAVVRAWLSHFRTEFGRRHDAIDIVKVLIMQNPACPPSVPELARAVGLSRRTLERGFRAVTHESIVEFRTRQRIEFVETLRQRGVKAEAAALLAGWKSKKNMYRARKRMASGNFT